MQAACKELPLARHLLLLQLLFALNTLPGPALPCPASDACEMKRRSLRNVCTKCTATCRLVQGDLAGHVEPDAIFTRIKRRQMLAIISFFFLFF